MNSAVDAFGQILTLAQPPRRVVSLVPSDTFTLCALGKADLIAGRTSFCVHPEASVGSIPTVGGTKTPRVDRIIELKPDLVLANREENRARHVQALREAGIPVFVSEPKSLSDSALHVLALGKLVGASAEADGIASRIAGARAGDSRHRPRALYFVWYDPIMGLAPDTYGWDILEAAGFEPWAPRDASRYPSLSERDIMGSEAEVVLFPSEPFAFESKHLEAFAARFPKLPAVSLGQLIQLPGEHATWHGAWAARGLPALKALREEKIKWRSSP